MERLLSRARGDGAARRGAVRGGRSLSLRGRAGEVPGTVQLAQFLHPAGAPNAPAQGTPQAMAGESRRTDPSLEEHLFTEGFVYEFFQAVRLLEAAFPEREPVGRDARPGDEVVRFHSRNTLTFPASTIHDLARSEGGSPAAMLVAFMGL